MNKISVVIPAYNVEKYIDKSFESLLNQTFKEFEVIAINDGSQDYTLEKMKAYEARDSRIRVINKANEGVGATRNLGLTLASSDYIIFIDPDDCLHPDMLKSLYEKAVETNANVIVCDYYECYEQSTDKTLMTIPVESTDLLVVEEQKDLIFKITPAPWNKLIKTSILKEHKIEFPLNYRSEDLVFTLKLLAQCKTLAIVHQPLYYYLANRMNNVSSSNDERILHTLQALKEILTSYERWDLKWSFEAELEMLVIKHIQYELHKVIYITDKELANRIINEFYQFIEKHFPMWRKNKYYYSLYQDMDFMNKYRAWIYEQSNRLKIYYQIQQLKRALK